MSSEVIYEKIIYEKEDRGIQLRLVVNIYKETEYIHIREYYMSFDEGYQPSNVGVSMPLSISGIMNLLEGLLTVCSMSESKDLIAEILLSTKEHDAKDN